MKVMAAELLRVTASPRDFPGAGLPEIAFLGRSNVGKSSLLNRLVARRQLARVSGTPGKTRLVQFYRVVVRMGEGRDSDRALLLVDLPGYGYAKVAKEERAAWQGLVESYLEGRAPLRAAVMLQDLRRDISEDETALLAWLTERGVPTLFVLTKADKLPPMQRARRVKELAAQSGVAQDRMETTSAEKGLGLDALWRRLVGLALQAP